METMHYRERRKKGYKFSVFCFFVFIVAGASVIYYGVTNETIPEVVGSNQSALEKKKMLEEHTALVAIYEQEQLEEINKTDIDTVYAISAVKYQNNDNNKIKADISVPSVNVGDEILEDVNKEIYDEFLSNFETYKENMKNVENNFTYKVTYISYSNIVGLKKVLSLIITESITDDDSKDSTMTKKYTYNIDLDTFEVLKQDDVVVDVVGSEYLSEIKNNLKEKIIEKGYFTEESYKYNYTGLEEYYIKDKNLHIVFNPSQINTDIKDLIDIEIIKKEEKE